MVLKAERLPLMNRTHSRHIEAVILILISFSPLVPNPIRATLVLLLVGLNARYVNRIRLNQTAVLITFMLVFAMSSICDWGNVACVGQMSILNLYFPLCFLLGFVVSQKYAIDEYLNCIERPIFVAAVLSLIGVLVYTFLPGLVYRLPVYHYYHTSHRTALIFNVLLVDGDIVRRNAGIAWEPGAFQMLLNLGLYSYVRCNGRRRALTIILYSLAIILTKSTAGLLVFVLLAFDIFKNDRRARLLVVVSVAVFGGFIREASIYHYTYKLFGSAAFATRFDPLLEALSVGRRYILGMGNSGYDLYYKDIIIAPWDSFGQICVRYGYIMLFLVLCRLLSILKNDRLLFAILAVTFAGQNVWFFPLITPLYFMEIKGIGAKAARGESHESLVVREHSTT